MANVDPVHQQCFLCSFCTETEDITKGLSTSRVASSNNHWTLWPTFCANVALDPLLLLYKDPIPILATFAAEYRCGDISASGKNAHYCTVEDAVRYIGQALTVMGSKDAQINSEGALYIRLEF